MSESVKGYKVFGPDMKCRDFQFIVGETYIHEGLVKLCESGFHFCLKAIDCFSYYDFNTQNKVCEVEADGVSDETGYDSKRVCGIIKIVRELSWYEVLDLVNTGKNNTGCGNSGNYNSGNYNSGNYNSGNYNSGNYNSGYYNSGNYNSGYYNSGYYNSGYYNSGNYNSGDRNSGYYNSGYRNSGLFNTDEPKLRCFGVDTDITMTQFIKENRLPYVNLVFQETKNDVIYKYSYKEAWKNWWNLNLLAEQKKILNLPNFNAKIFEEITGININELNT